MNFEFYYFSVFSHILCFQNTGDFYDLYGGEKFATLSELVQFYTENQVVGGGGVGGVEVGLGSLGDVVGAGGEVRGLCSNFILGPTEREKWRGDTAGISTQLCR